LHKKRRKAKKTQKKFDTEENFGYYGTYPVFTTHATVFVF